MLFDRFAVRLTSLLLAIPVVATMSVGASALEIPPHKDSLFVHPKLLSEGDGGRYRVYDYREMRDINQRDEIPERRVQGKYVALGVRREQQDLSLDGVAHVAVGRREGASVIVVYLHGQGGSRKQGVDDFTFGGNFNRAKNLVAGAGGLYLSPDFPDFGKGGAAAVGKLLGHYGARSPGAKIVVACGSAGGALCWELAKDADLAQRLGGLMLLGSHWDENFLRGEAFKARVPVLFAHGGRDSVFPVDKQEAFFRAILAAKPNYPARFLRFESGTHGTPIRMVDWRESLNWMLKQ